MTKARKIKGEGWDVFDSNGAWDGNMQICKVDDPGANLRYPADIQAFRTDCDAILFVIS